MPSLITFAGRELETFAEAFLVKNRLASLHNDVELCITMTNKKTEQYAPFPALEYCFSVIDLLGALYAGHARKGNTVSNSKEYMRTFMKSNGKFYEKWQVELLQMLFRHKIVHLSEPKTSIHYKGKVIGWRHDETNTHKNEHLQIVYPNPPRKLHSDIYGKTTIYGDGEFVISILQFEEEIKDSVTRSTDGYLNKLRADPKLQKKFETAINQIFDPKIID